MHGAYRVFYAHFIWTLVLSQTETETALPDAIGVLENLIFSSFFLVVYQNWDPSQLSEW